MLELQGHDWTLSYRLESQFRYIISEQESYGWFIDNKQLTRLLDDLLTKRNILEIKIKSLAPKRILNEGELKTVIKKDGSPTTHLLNWWNNLDTRTFLPQDVVGAITRIKVEQINPESPKQRIEALLKTGWRPTEYNYKTNEYNKPIYDDNGGKIPLSPKLTADSVKGNELGELMIKYVQLSHRLKLTEGLQKRIRKDGAIGGGGLTVGANTGRMLHRNIVNIPRVGEYYGEEIRSLFSHRPGYILLGADLSALENRLMGHYTYNIDGGKYAQRLLNEDPHDRTSKILNINRNDAKTVNYALSYGATFHKLKDILRCSETDAKKAHKAWWDDKKPLLVLKNKLLDCSKHRTPMWIKGIDGRKVFCRSKHSLLNALIQSAGSVVNKFITCCVYKEIQRQGLDAHFVCNYHDEIDLEVKNCEKTLDKLKEIIYNSIERTNKFFDFKVPMKMDIKIGNNWKEIH